MRYLHTRTVLTILVYLVGLGGSADVIACDTWVALANATAARLTILAKNSDRPSFDAQPLMFYPRRSWPAGAMIDLGRIKIPQVKRIFNTLRGKAAASPS